MKGETGRLAGERGDRGLTLDIPQSGISEQENNRQQKVKRLKRKQKYPLFVFNVAYKKTPEVTLMNRLLHNDEHLNKSLNPSRSWKMTNLQEEKAPFQVKVPHSK